MYQAFMKVALITIISASLNIQANHVISITEMPLFSEHLVYDENLLITRFIEKITALVIMQVNWQAHTLINCAV